MHKAGNQIKVALPKLHVASTYKAATDASGRLPDISVSAIAIARARECGVSVSRKFVRKIEIESTKRWRRWQLLKLVQTLATRIMMISRQLANLTNTISQTHPEPHTSTDLNSQYMMERRWGFEPNTTPPKAKAL